MQYRLLEIVNPSVRMISLAEPGNSIENQPSSVVLTSVLAGASRGDASSWETLVELYSRRVFALARSRCNSSELAEEITQSVFVTIAAKLSTGQYSEEGKFEPWIFRVAMNRIRDEVRRRSRHAVPTDTDSLGNMPGLETLPSPGDQETAASELSALRKAITELSDSDREIIELRHHGQMNFKDMSQLLDEPLGTLLARHHRALRKLKEIIESQLNPTRITTQKEPT